MRYMNWDVLLFPDGSKIPLQEFKTGCYITQEPDPGLDHSTVSATPRYLPTVATFIPNIPLGSPLKVSIHSWEPPVPSPETQGWVRQGEQILFEARVLLDGVCVAGILFDQQPPWPQVIDPGKEGTSLPLTFPAFHSEMLTQNYWNAGENIGRVKIFIAEGIVRYQGSPFEKTRSIVCFSFQHAPLRVLEDSGIAYPNPGMLYQLQNQIFGTLLTRKQEPDPDAHSHSPRHRGCIASAPQSRMAISPALTLPEARAHEHALTGPQFADPYWAPMPAGYDIFTDGSRYQTFKKWAAPSSSGDLSMPDYSNSLTPASSRNHSNHQDPLSAATMDNTLDPEELDNSPNRPASRGTIPPANTRVNSAANTPRSRPSAAAEARASSYSHSQARSVPVTTRDPPPPEVREPSDVSMKLRLSEGQAEANEQNEMKTKKPARDVKGRKEGKAFELGLGPQIHRMLSAEVLESQKKENMHGSAEKPIVLSDSKRKRSTIALSEANRALNEINPNSSPCRKVSKVETSGDHDLDDLTPDGVVMRAPLADVGSIF